jgi:hypothetical protein
MNSSTPTPQHALPASSTACGKEWAIQRRAVVLAQAAAYENLAKTLKEEAALLAKQAGLVSGK